MWQWRIECGQVFVKRSNGVFYTLDECIKDARHHGFHGHVNCESGVFAASSYEMESRDTSHELPPA
jgi:hypothetical protein